MAEGEENWKVGHAKGRHALEEKKGKRINTSEQLPFVDALNVGVYSQRNIHIIIDTEIMNTKEEATGNRYTEGLKREEPWLHNKKIYFWLDYNSIPREATIFDFYDDDGKIAFDNIYHTLSKSCDRNGYQYGIKVRPSSIDVMPANHVAELKRAVRLFYKDKLYKIRKEGEEVSIEKFTRMLLKRKDVLKKLSHASA